MAYTIENKQDTVIESVLLTTEQAFAALKDVESSARNQNRPQSSTEVYFQIED